MNLRPDVPVHSVWRAIGDEIERLLVLLDELDADPDFEPDDEEPSLGWPEYGPGALAADQIQDDREIEPEHDEDGGDLEPDVDDEPGLGGPSRANFDS